MATHSGLMNRLASYGMNGLAAALFTDYAQGACGQGACSCLVRAVVALVADADEDSRPHVRIADHTDTIVLLTKPADRNARLLPAHDQIRMVLGHAYRTQQSQKCCCCLPVGSYSTGSSLQQ
jgi:hypothetical protein